MTEEASTPTVRDATLDVLRRLGMTTVFSNPSHTEMKLFEYWPEDEFRFVMGLQEAAVVGMADGYAQATGEPALVLINGGPGLGNAMGSVYTAAAAKTPMVILGGQQARKMLLGDPFLVAKDATQLPKPYIKWAGEPGRPQDVPALIAQAYQIAKQAPQGPVFVAVPEDDWVRPADPEPVRIPEVRAAVVPDPRALERIAEALNGAERPGIVAGGPVDAQGARGDLIALAEKLNARVWGAPVWARGAFPENHPLFAGVLPPIPELINERLGAQHDVVVVLGGPAFTLFTAWDLFSTAPADLDRTPRPTLTSDVRFLHVTDSPQDAAATLADESFVAPPGAASPPSRHPLWCAAPARPRRLLGAWSSSPFALLTAAAAARTTTLPPTPHPPDRPSPSAAPRPSLPPPAPSSGSCSWAPPRAPYCSRCPPCWCPRSPRTAGETGPGGRRSPWRTGPPCWAAERCCAAA
ncbi:hypothetical protein SGLAM104S_01765 [Streptomyces glaucescens]